MLWHEIDFSKITKIPTPRGGYEVKYDNGPLKFQIPFGNCKYGLNSFTNDRGAVSLTMNIDYVEHQSFQNWFRDLETAMGIPEPFSSNLKDENLRLRIEDTTLFLNWVEKVDSLDVKEGALRGYDLIAIVEIPSVYFFKEQYGLTMRATQIRYKYKDPPFLFDI